jgi:hypothetical protein
MSDISVDPLDPELVSAMLAVSLDRVSPTDAWLGYLRARHPEAVEALAKAAMTDMALDLMVAHGDITSTDALQQRAAAAESASQIVPDGTWERIAKLKQSLERLATTTSATEETPVALEERRVRRTAHVVRVRDDRDVGAAVRQAGAG